MSRKGFTLVELLIVLAILGLLAFIGVPRYLDTLDRAKKAADNGVIANVQFAVDVFIGETKDGLTKLMEGDGLNWTASAESILTGDIIWFGDYLITIAKVNKNEEGKVTSVEPPALKSKTSDVNWTIDEEGRVKAE